MTPPLQPVPKIWQRRTRVSSLFLWLGWLVGLLVFLYCAQLLTDKTNWNFVLDAPQQGANMLRRGVPPRWSYLDQLWRPLWDTLTIATLGTLLSAVVAVPLAFLAARNTTPHPVVRQLALLVIVSSRSVNVLIWALVLALILGPGVFTGVMAVALRSIGFVGKLIYEGIEEIDPKPVEAIVATGASAAQVLSYGIWPQVISTILGVNIYRWDINIRESTVVGLVGAGGIGLQLKASTDTLQWSQASLILLLIFGSVFVSEWISAKARQAMV